MVAPNGQRRCPGTIGRLTDHARWPVTAQEAYNLAPQFQGGLQLSIGILSKDNGLQTKDFASRLLFFYPRLHHSSPRQRGHISRIIRPAASTISADYIIDIPSLTRPQSCCARAPKLRVIGMRHNSHRNLVLFLLTHDLLTPIRKNILLAAGILPHRDILKGP